MSDTDSDIREGVELQPSGTIRVWIEIDGKPKAYRLRRPRFRQYRQLRELLQDALDEIAALAEIADERGREQRELAEQRDAAGSQPLTADERAQNRKEARELRDRREELLLDWWVAVGEALADSWPQDPDELPVWMGSTESTTLILNHWRAVPSLSGVR